MASVFLSYDHEDDAQARAIAAALENAGHSVWWDRQIIGGAQYNSEIESAVARSDAVIVLWSARSVQSTWVRDEAAEGRDKGKLIPVSLDNAKPPMGFRQFQTIKLPGRKRGNRTPNLAELLRAVGAFGKPGAEMPPALGTRVPLVRRTSPVIIAVLAIAAIAMIAALLWQPWSGQRIPLVTVAPADNSAASNALAGDLLIKLGSLQSSQADALQLIEQSSNETPDFTFKVGSADVTGEPRASLALIDNRDGVLMWSREFVQPRGNQADLRQQIAYSAAQVLSCATEALSTEHQKLRLPTLKLYLSGCADLATFPAQNPQLSISTFAKVTQQAPKFPGGWGKLLLAEAWSLALADYSDQGLTRDLKNHITQAQQVDPSMAEVFLAKAWIQPPRPISGWMKFADLAVAKSPNNPEVLANHAMGLVSVGYMREALIDARRAVEFNPLSPSARSALVEHLLNNGQVEAARNELEKSERLWPGATTVLESRVAFESRVGDAARALQMLQSGQLGRSVTPHAKSYLKARMEPSSANIERAVTDIRTLYRQDPDYMWNYVLTLALFERHEELVDALLQADPRTTWGVVWVLFRPDFTNLHKDRRFMVIAQRFGVLEYWQETGKWPDFCSDSDLPYDCKEEAAKLA